MAQMMGPTGSRLSYNGLGSGVENGFGISQQGNFSLDV